jgi:hypothetical protein
MGIKEIGLEGVECVFIAQVSDKWRAILNEVLSLFSEELQNFFYFSPSIIWVIEIMRVKYGRV